MVSWEAKSSEIVNSLEAVYELGNNKWSISMQRNEHPDVKGKMQEKDGCKSELEINEPI